MEENKTETSANIPTRAQVNQKPKERFGKKIYYLLPVLLMFVALTLYVFNPPPANLKKEALEKPIQTAFFLAIDSPKTETAAVNGEILIEGRTLPNTTVVIYSDTDEASLESDAEGNFKDTVVVGDQGGLVRITAFLDNGAELSKTIDVGDFNVLGKSDKAPGRNNEDNTRGNSENNSNKEEKGNQKQENTQNQSNTQSRISETERQTTPKVKSNKPLNVSEFLKDKVKIERPVKIGAGRMIDILSKESTTGASLDKNLKLKKMEAKQATDGAQLKRHAVSGVITNISGGVITLAHQIQREKTYTIYYNDSTEISMKDKNSSGSASLSSGLVVGMRIAVVGIPTDTGLLATRIHVIPGKAIGVFNKSILNASPTGTESATPTVSEAPTGILASPFPTINP